MSWSARLAEIVAPAGVGVLAAGCVEPCGNAASDAVCSCPGQATTALCKLQSSCGDAGGVVRMFYYDKGTMVGTECVLPDLGVVDGAILDSASSSSDGK